MSGPSTFGWGAGENSEIGENPVLSRNCEAGPKAVARDHLGLGPDRTSQVA